MKKSLIPKSLVVISLDIRKGQKGINSIVVTNKGIPLFFSKNKNSPKLSHLVLVDDVIIFSEANLKHTKTILNILTYFSRNYDQ